MKKSQLQGLVTIHGLHTRMTLEEARSIVGPLYESLDQPGSALNPVRYMCELVPGLEVFKGREVDHIEIIHGEKVELNGNPILELGFSREQIISALGQPAKQETGSRQFWNYPELNTNDQGICLMLDDGVLTAVLTSRKPSQQWLDAVDKANRENPGDVD